MAETSRPRRQPSRTQVAAFLRAVGRPYEVTDELYQVYAPLVAAAGRQGLPRYRLAVAMVTSAPGHRPPPADEFLAAWRSRQAEHQAAREEAARIAERDRDAAQAYVARIRADTGAGPTWAELANHLEWPDALKERIVRQMKTAGVLRYTTAPRSLDVVDD